MNKYMLTIQHDQQKVAYIEFGAENNKQAILKGDAIYKEYEKSPSFMPSLLRGVTGNFSGSKPRVAGHWISMWVKSDSACNAWGVPCGGYWSTIKQGEG